MGTRGFILVLLWLVAAGIFASAQSTQEQIVKPISQQGLTDALKIGGLTTEELVDIVKQRGVAFAMNAEVESDLRAAGAATPLIEAVRANYRPPAAPLPVSAAPAVPLDPLGKKEVLTLLQVGTAPARIAQIVKQRGVNFPLTPAVTDELRSAGADAVLLTTLETAWGKSGANPPASPESPAAPTASVPAPTPNLTSLKAIRKLYIEKMKNKLDEYLRVEISKQLPERLQIVLNKELADASLVGTGEQNTSTGSVLTGGYLGLQDTATGSVAIVDKGGTVLWASEAGDRTLLFRPLMRGGTREVASRLVQNLKKSLQTEE